METPQSLPKTSPIWKVTLGPPKGDDEEAIVTSAGFSQFTDGFRNARFEYNDKGAIVYEVGLDYIPEDR